ncbi:hypothetical protein PV325_005024 [Microctonus aethiopoides]|uniref:Alpha 1,4-glycosyltransferase domain-containing protein n=1 Tax=Microctonus aethiopoides TaxID=144406 RepID=A0AA39FZA6_9HYME|nr:hypothetical protein PV325_005024 [Microctonus aethiopoides]KAK0177919.1 hypothetical protein PV328_001916 [Microctonus aethiopoides]
MKKSTKRKLIAIGCGVVFCFLIHFYYRKKVIPDETTSWMNFTITKDHLFPRNRSIFFLETSHINKSEIILNARQCCAVESAAIMNPTMTVHLFIFTDAFVKDTPIEEWWNKTNVLKTSLWPTVHISDILRLITIWKYGGIYFDTDVVVKSSFEEIGNFAGAEDSNLVANGIFGFEKTGIGYSIIEACLQELIKDFRGDLWIHNGPRVLTVTLQKFCGTQNTNLMTYDRCSGFTVFPTAAFYPIHWSEWQRYFQLDDKHKTMTTIEKSLVIHVWNKLSSSTIIKVGSDVPYARIANKYCPQIYNNCGETF